MCRQVKEWDFIVSEQNKNKGFSLIEIIVVIALLAIVTGASAAAFSSVKSHKIKEFAGNINNAISETRTNTLTKSGSYELVITYESNQFVAKLYHNGSLLETKTLTKDKKASISCVGATSSANFKVEDGNDIRIAFNKADGSFSKMMIGSEEIKGSISVERAARTKVINLVKLTGKHYMNS